MLLALFLICRLITDGAENIRPNAADATLGFAPAKSLPPGLD